MNQQKHILYIDDEIINLELFKMSFKKDFIVTTCDSGKKALELLHTIPDIDVVITDLNMPHMDGLEFINNAIVNHRNLPYYILSGYNITAEVNDAMENGYVKKYFTKPFNKKEIIEEIYQL